MPSIQRLPLTDPLRMEARRQKLWSREMSVAIRYALRKKRDYLEVVCPCRLCNRGTRMKKTVTSVLEHLDEVNSFGRDPISYGSMQGFAADESDDEWDAHIMQRHGELVAQNNEPEPIDSDEEDENDYLAHCVAATFETYDNLFNEVFADDGENVLEPNQVQHDEAGREGSLQDRQHVSQAGSSSYNEENLNSATSQLPSSSSPLRQPQSSNGNNVPGNNDPGDDSDEGLAAMEEDVEEDDENWSDAPDQFVGRDDASLHDSARTPLYPQSKVTVLTAVILILNCMRMYGASSGLINEIFVLLSKVILPEVNDLPKSEYEASKMLKRIGLNYESIDVCPNQCILFWGPEYEHLTSCPKCHASRKKRIGKSFVSRRVLRYFPLIPRLIRLFISPLLAAAVLYAGLHKSLDGKLRSIADSAAWSHVDRLYPEFASDLRNLRLALATDGINPFSGKRGSYSVWPVLLLNLNVAPWLTLKKFFVMLSMIIPGKKSVTGDHFDMYLQPLLKELQRLWVRGVRIKDSSRVPAEAYHNLKAMLLFTIHDYPAYGIVAGVVTKGYRGCVCCGPNNTTRRSSSLKKNVWDHQHRIYLPPNHWMREEENMFRGRCEHRQASQRMTGIETRLAGEQRESWLRSGASNQENDPIRVHGVKRKSALFELPYWEHLLIRNSLDVMHVERNVSASLLGFILGEKDTVHVRRDMEEIGIPENPIQDRNPRFQHTPHLHLQPTRTPGRYFKPHAPYSLTTRDRGSFINLIARTRTPTGYASHLGRHLEQKRLGGLKSHDFHVLVQQIIPACIRSFLHPGARDAVIRLGNVFKRICAKVIDREGISDLLTYTAETLCLLEVWFPPGFWDVMPHLVIHLVEEVALLGPVHSRWCYGVERYLYILKKSVRNRFRPEACMASGYITDEALGYITDFTQLSLYLRRRIWDMEDDDKVNGEVLEGGVRRIKLDDRERRAIHDYVIWNSTPCEDLRREYEAMAGRQRRQRGHRRVPLQEFSSFVTEKVQDLLDSGADVEEDLAFLCNLPEEDAEEYSSMWAYGNHYRCLVDNDEILTHQTYDAGVFVMSPQQCRASAADRNLVLADLPYIGILKKIIAVTYATTTRILMKCSWIVPNLAGNASVRQDDHGFWLAKTIIRQDDTIQNPYVFPFSVSQVFFVEDLENPGWKVVVEKAPRSSHSIEIHEDRARPDTPQHMFDAPGRSNRSPLREENQREAEAYMEAFFAADAFERTADQISSFEVEAPAVVNATEPDTAAWLEEDFEDEDYDLNPEAGV